MRKILCLTLVLLLTFTVFGCSAPEKMVKISFVQDGQETIVKEYKKGDGLNLDFQPVQPSDTSLITEWNVSDDYVVSVDDTIYITTYTKGLSFKFYYDKTAAYEVEKYSGEAERVIIPKEYKGVRVIQIAGRGVLVYGAFEFCKHVKDVELPEGLLTIKQYAFNGCTSLEKVNLPSTLETVENHAFVDCKITSSPLVLSGNATYGERAFFSLCSNTLIISEGVTDIPSFCFAGKTGRLFNVVLPLSLTNISGTAFWLQPIKNVFYCGNEGDFYNLNIDDESYGEENFANYLFNGGERYIFDGVESNEFVKPVIYYYSETQPQIEGDFWRYVDGQPTVWGKINTI